MSGDTRSACCVLLAALGLSVVAAAPAAGDCTQLGSSVLCDGRLSTNQVGRRLVFPRGSAGERVGDFAVSKPGGVPQVLERPRSRPSRRPLSRFDDLTDPRRGRDFGAFEFPSAPLKLRHRSRR